MKVPTTTLAKHSVRLAVQSPPRTMIGIGANVRDAMESFPFAKRRLAELCSFTPLVEVLVSHVDQDRRVLRTPKYDLD